MPVPVPVPADGAPATVSGRTPQEEGRDVVLAREATTHVDWVTREDDVIESVADCPPRRSWTGGLFVLPSVVCPCVGWLWRKGLGGTRAG
jgi:hypothetical protein